MGVDRQFRTGLIFHIYFVLRYLYVNWCIVACVVVGLVSLVPSTEMTYFVSSRT